MPTPTTIATLTLVVCTVKILSVVIPMKEPRQVQPQTFKLATLCQFKQMVVRSLLEVYYYAKS
jgi:hypothetical protein